MDIPIIIGLLLAAALIISLITAGPAENYSASESYYRECDLIRKRLISPNNIKKPKFYVLHQSKGYFVHNTWVLKYPDFNPSEYAGEYYGPFKTEEAAEDFGRHIERTHLDFILG